jgi:hypothetical protein
MVESLVNNELERYEKRDRDLILSKFPRICLEGLRRSMENLRMPDGIRGIPISQQQIVGM